MASRRRFLNIFLVSVLAFAPALIAQPAHRVKDINPIGAGPAPCCLAGDGGRVYFQANDGAHGAEAWVSDGTLDGTQLLVDAVAGPGSFSPHFFVRAGAFVFFTGLDPVAGVQLWKTDGTASGTSLVGAIGPPATGGFEIPPVAVGGTLFFAGFDANGIEPWISDGTAAGTHILRDVNAGPASSGPQNLTVVNEIVYFSATDGVTGLELWRSDGSELGTVRVRDINPGAASSAPSSLVGMGDRLFFAATDPGNGRELWMSDGTEAGTVLVADIRSGPLSSSPEALTAAGQTVFFRADDGANSKQLWRSDGTSDGTALVKVVEVNPTAPGPDLLVAVGSRIFFRWSHQGASFGVWTSDGTEAGTLRLASGLGTGLTAAGDRAYFGIFRGLETGELWVSDGTQGGTGLVRTFADSIFFSPPNSLVFQGGVLYFVAADGTLGPQLWRSDGTSAGTFVVRAMNPGSADSNPGQFREAGGKLFFVAQSRAPTLDLWQSDGTEGGTSLVSNASSDALVSDGRRIFFFGSGIGSVLWESDGSPGGTGRIAGQPDGLVIQDRELVASGGRAFWVARLGSEDPGLWVTDENVPATARRLRTFNRISEVVYAPEGVLFGAGDSGPFYDLWKSDGTLPGTHLVHVYRSNLPIQILRVGARYFVLTSPTGSDLLHRELWVTDGTDAGTSLVWNFGPFFTGGITFAGSVHGSALLKATAVSGGYDLWRSDGTAPGTFLLCTFSGTFSALGEITKTFDGAFFPFSPDGIWFRQLWATDGSVLSTRLVRDFSDVASSYLPPIGKLLDVAGTLVFGLRADADAQLWRCDGTPGGTVPFQSGVSAENPTYYLPPPGLAVGDKVFFAGRDRYAGSELWAMPVSAAYQPRPTSLSLLSPCRIIDTRQPTGFSGGPALSAGVPRVFPVGGACGIPWTARAIAANVTVTGATADGLLKIHPSDIGSPETSVINFRAGQTRANNATIALGPDAEFTVRFVASAGTGEVHVIVDVVGWYE